MAVWGQRGRRGRRSPRRLLGHLLETRYGAAEGVLGAVAVVLVLWLLWPEERGPQLDQRATWQQSVEEAEHRRVASQSERKATDSALETQTSRSATRPVADNGFEIAERSAEPRRRRIAMPSELADPLDRFGRRPGQHAGNALTQPGPKRPHRPDGPDEDLEPVLQAEITPESEPATIGVAASEASSVQTLSVEASAALVGLAREMQMAPLVPVDNDDEQTFEVVVLSSEALDAEPLPEVDLSDLDTLVPLDNADQASAAPFEPLAEEDAEQVAALPSASLAPDDASLATSTDAAIAPFRTEEGDAKPAADVGERPRDNAPTWLKNAVATAGVDERPMIAIVIDDLGLNRPNTAALNDLPSPLTLAFLPYAGRIEAQTEGGS